VFNHIAIADRATAFVEGQLRAHLLEARQPHISEEALHTVRTLKDFAGKS